MYQWKKFSLALSVSFAFLLTTLGFFWYKGVVFAVPVGGIGGFNVTADEIRMENMSMISKIGDSSEKQNVPMTTIKMDGTIKNLNMSREVTLPLIGTIKLTIHSAKIAKGTDVILDVSKISGDITFDGIAIAEKFTINPSQKFSLKAKSATIKNAKIIAHYLYASSLNIPNMGLDFTLKPPKE